MGTMKGRSISTRKMSDAHEDWLIEQLGGSKAKGSGNQWTNPMDGRHNHLEVEHAYAWDAKSTLGNSIGITPDTWDKAVEQAGAERPAMPLRWYEDERLKVRLDLVVISMNDFTELLADARDTTPKSKIEIDGRTTRDVEIRVDGVLMPPSFNVSINSGLDDSTEVTVNGTRPLYDTEVWINGELRFRVQGVVSEVRDGVKR